MAIDVQGILTGAALVSRGQAAPSALAPGDVAQVAASGVATPIADQALMEMIPQPGPAAPAQPLPATSLSDAARQGSLAPLLADLAEAVESVPLPASVQSAAARVLALQTPIEPAPSATDLRQALARSGVMLEAKLAAVVAAPSQPPPRPQGDLKSAMLVLSQALEAWLPEQSAPAPPGTRDGSADAPAPTANVTQLPSSARPAPIPEAPPDTVAAAQPATVSPNAPAPNAPNASVTPPPGSPQATVLPEAPPASVVTASPIPLPPGATAPTASVTPPPESPQTPPLPEASPASVAAATPTTSPFGAPAPTATVTPPPASTQATALPDTPLATVAASATSSPGATTPMATGTLPSASPQAAPMPTALPAPSPTVAQAVRAPMATPTEAPADLSAILIAAQEAATPRLDGRDPMAGLRLLQEGLPAPAPQSAASRAAPPPPFRGGPTSAQPPALPALPPGADPLAVGLRLLHETAAALARHELLQLASLPHQAQTGEAASTQGARWSFEIPFATPQGATIAQFEIAKDGGGGPDRADGTPIWRARFSLDMEPLGPVHAEIALMGERASVALWAERPESLQQLNEGRGNLVQDFREVELSAEVAIHAGAPRRTAPAAGRFLDQAT